MYSASEVASEEFPDYDATVRGTISIGRRLQDPLSELVKIQPHHIGVGMYQHDLSEKKLEKSLDDVVESCVNHVGVDLNRASAELLKHVSGLNRSIAKKIVAYRNDQGAFQTRTQLMNVPGVGETTFTQAAGFLRIQDGTEPLDRTWIHPESYEIARALLSRYECDVSILTSSQLPESFAQKLQSADEAAIATELGTGVFTASQVIESLLKPGRDPREELPGPIFRTQVLKFDDLAVGMELKGVVTNVVDFGAFIDVGLKSDGLVHISKMSDKFVESPLSLIAVGEVLTVWIDQLDEQRKRIGLSMIRPQQTPDSKSTEK